MFIDFYLIFSVIRKVYSYVTDLYLFCLSPFYPNAKHAVKRGLYSYGLYDKVVHIMHNTKLLYTAVTRAKKMCIIIGEEAAFKGACRRIDTTQRTTELGLKAKDK